jgi:hypothetical protein
MFVAAHAPAPVVFSDTFSPAPSAVWGNEVGAWTASGGAYFATAPNNNPTAISSLPYNLTDFSVDFDVNNVTDGGIFLRATVVPGGPAGVKGILLNLKVPAGGPRIYWHVFTDGTNATPALNLTNLDYGPNPHVHVEVSGDTYSAFINGSPTPTSTLTTNIFPAGRVALYDSPAKPSAILSSRSRTSSCSSAWRPPPPSFTGARTQPDTSSKPARPCPPRPPGAPFPAHTPCRAASTRSGCPR